MVRSNRGMSTRSMPVPMITRSAYPRCGALHPRPGALPSVGPCPVPSVGSDSVRRRNSPSSDLQPESKPTNGTRHSSCTITIPPETIHNRRFRPRQCPQMSDARTMIDPADLLIHTDGVARSGWLTAHGCTKRQLADAVDTGRIHRIRRGVFALPRTDSKVIDAALHGGALTCADALRAHGVWVLPEPDPTVHVWLGRAGRPRPHRGCEGPGTPPSPPGAAPLN